MKFTDEQIKSIYTEYMEYVNHVSDVLEGKTHFTPEEVVMAVLALVERELSMTQPRQTVAKGFQTPADTLVVESKGVKESF